MPTTPREIKFRAWDKEKKQIIYPVLKEGDNFASFWPDHSPQRFDFMQFTGLLDKHGKEIFEGDLVTFIRRKKRFHSPKHDLEVFNLEVKYRDASFNLPELLWEDESLEVVGNIYEHPHLLHSNA